MKAPVTTATRCLDCGERLGPGVYCADQRLEDRGAATQAGPDLDALAAWLSTGNFVTRGGLVQDRITPADLMRPPWHLTWNGACSALEELGARGDLERVPGPGLVWKLRQKPAQPQDEPFRLTQEEREVLINGLEFVIWRIPDPADRTSKILRNLRDRLERRSEV